MGKSTGFIEFSRKNCIRENELKRINHWNEFDTPLTEEERKEQGARCMDCGVPFCQSGIILNNMATGCPLNNLIPEWNNFIYLGKWKLGLERLLKTSNFPEFTSRVCPALCENACTCGLHGNSVSVKANEKYLIEKGFSEGIIKANPPKIRTGKKVAIIGSGPSGLACADFLNRLGHNVTVYEREDHVGGLMMYGIPNMKLEKNIIKRRVDILKEEGIIFKTCVNVGIDISVEELNKEYDAIVITVGASKPRDLKVSGRELNGIYFAVKYLTNNTKRIIGSNFNKGLDILATNKDVIIIGGGDTGTDCVGTAIRQGCKSVNQFEIMGEPLKVRGENNPWPEYAKILKIDYGQEECIAKFGHDPRRYLTSVKEFYGDENGNVKSLKTVDVEWIKNKDGKMVLKEIEGSEKIWNADLVLIAMGFTGVEDYIVKDLGVEINNRGSINANDIDYKTSNDKIFVAGDARRGPSLVVWGITEGRNVALSVDKYLMK
ncbi:glutamate synthase subunit beta [Clostridium sp.]|jgi:glutamate synthase (NADPH/NADH) small chain|uniref:glutamate synthase subunit beta n=1 Tax=Clostridium sp. TaxID=1506 RepID=UPI0025B9D54D|nr:glutamate synthase subunit beta [Clostridium sp.]MCI9070467.1 glutamate synthase subunit beta [Clostridium sp.]MCI9304532.1 glutamate synthase subunit beta [Clostridium sp.]